METRVRDVMFLHKRRSIGAPCSWRNAFAPKEYMLPGNSILMSVLSTKTTIFGQKNYFLGGGSGKKVIIKVKKYSFGQTKYFWAKKVRICVKKVLF